MVSFADMTQNCLDESGVEVNLLSLIGDLFCLWC